MLTDQKRYTAHLRPNIKHGLNAYILISWQVGVAVLIAAQLLLFRRYFFSRLRRGLGHVLIFPHFGINPAPSAPTPTSMPETEYSANHESQLDCTNTGYFPVKAVQAYYLYFCFVPLYIFFIIISLSFTSGLCHFKRSWAIVLQLSDNLSKCFFGHCCFFIHIQFTHSDSTAQARTNVTTVSACRHL